MERLSRVCVRHNYRQVPVYIVEDDASAEELSKRLENGELKVIAEYTQFGVEHDITHEIFVDGEKTFSIMTITPGGELGRLKKKGGKAKHVK